MSANGSAMPTESSEIQDKGKGKQVEPTNDMSIDEEDDEQEESGVDEVSNVIFLGRKSNSLLTTVGT
jgi:hypothetical protein